MRKLTTHCVFPLQQSPSSVLLRPISTHHSHSHSSRSIPSLDHVIRVSAPRPAQASCCPFLLRLLMRFAVRRSQVRVVARAQSERNCSSRERDETSSPSRFRSHYSSNHRRLLFLLARRLMPQHVCCSSTTFRNPRRHLMFPLSRADESSVLSASVSVSKRYDFLFYA